jgi:cellulose synthase/poly-beta-1,6-N-acetylglucosamine synthase-like glycosyltransferase
MSNGANLAFRKNAFLEVGGYTGTEHLATGDDYLLMNKIKKASPGGIAYLKTTNAVVTTAPQRTWKNFVQQRIRWASKSGKYSDNRLTGILSLVYIFNLVMLVIGIWGFFNPYLWHLALAMIIVKIAAESFFILPVARFFHKEGVLKYFPFLQPLHVIYIVATGFMGFIGKYEWKGRRVS